MVGIVLGAGVRVADSYSVKWCRCYNPIWISLLPSDCFRPQGVFSDCHSHDQIQQLPSLLMPHAVLLLPVLLVFLQTLRRHELDVELLCHSQLPTAGKPLLTGYFYSLSSRLLGGDLLCRSFCFVLHASQQVSLALGVQWGAKLHRQPSGSPQDRGWKWFMPLSLGEQRDFCGQT